MILNELAQLMDDQANDEGLWFIAETAPEAYIQRELRKLHDAVEKVLDQRNDWLLQKLKEGEKQ